MTLKKQEFVEAAFDRFTKTYDYNQTYRAKRHRTNYCLRDFDCAQRDAAGSIPKFFRLGIQPPQSSWGLLINYGVETMEEYPWLLVFPGLALTITLFALNFLGDGLRDALDPKISKD